MIAGSMNGLALEGLFVRVAQLEEQVRPKDKVVGSTPSPDAFMERFWSKVSKATYHNCMSYCVEVDSREQQPLLFPANLLLNEGQGGGRRVAPISTRTVALTFGDYRLASNPSGVVIERKKNLREIAGNLFDTIRRARFVAEMERLRSQCSHPVLLFEGSPSSLLADRPQPGTPSAEESLDALVCLLLEYRVTPLFLPSNSLGDRRATGVYAAHLLVRGETHGHRQPVPRTTPDG